MRFISLILVSILCLSACNTDDGALPTLQNLAGPTTTLVPTTQAQEIATQIASENITVVVPTDEPATETSNNDQPSPTTIIETIESSTQTPTLEPSSPTAEPTQVESTATPVPTETSSPTETPSPTETASPTDTTVPTETPSPTETDLPTETPVPTETPIPCEVQDEWDVYTIQRGDNLVSIANRTGSTVEELTEANCLDNPNLVRSGQELYVPNLPETPIPATDESDDNGLDDTQPSFSVSINKTFESEIGFGLTFPVDWFITESQTPTVENAFITSFEYTPGDEIPQNRWTDEMVSITVAIFQETTDESLSEWSESMVEQFEGATNITEVFAPVEFRTDGEIEGLSIDYMTDDDTIIRNYYFIIDEHKVQLTVGGNFDLAVPVIDSLETIAEN